MKLNKWQRIGVVLSIIWAIGAGIYLRYDLSQTAGKLSAAVYTSCLDRDTYNRNYKLENYTAEDCSKEYLDMWHSVMDNTGSDLLIVVLLPIPIMWGLAFLLIRIYRWVRAGEV